MTSDRGRRRRLWSHHLEAWRLERRSLGSLRAALLRLREGLGVVEVSNWISENGARFDARLDELERQLCAAQAHVVDLEAAAHEGAARVLEREAQTAARLQALTHALDAQSRELRVAHFMVWLHWARPESKKAVSVVLPSRNRVEWIGAAIASVMAQTHEHWELLVVDDGSTDGTAELLHLIDDERVRVLAIEGVGVCAARNVALDHATGDVIVYLDDDNVMHPDWLRAVTWAFDARADVDVLFGARVIDDEDVVHGRGPGGLPFLHWIPYDRAQLEHGNTVDMNVIAHRRELDGARFDETLSILGDWDLFLRLTEDKPPLELPALACVYRTDAHDRLSDGPGLPGELDYVRAKLRDWCSSDANPADRASPPTASASA